MKDERQGQFDFGQVFRRKPDSQELRIIPTNGKVLSPAQTEFNRLMRRLEKEREKQQQKRAELDKLLARVSAELLPLIEENNRMNLGLVRAGRRLLDSLKLTARRRRWFGDLVSGKAADLLGDPHGLGDEDLADLRQIINDLLPCVDDQAMDEAQAEEFDFLVGTIEEMARQQGVNLDLSGLDPQADPAELERLLEERFAEAQAAFKNNGPARTRRSRKPSKAQLERERVQAASEEAKKRDLKSLFKTLAKVLHPDLERDPVLKEHREAWMKRLNQAYENDDLHDMLLIEMEWLGEEESNLVSAADEKLAVYCLVLKEQIAEMKEQTGQMSYLPEYGILDRLRHPYFDRLHPIEEVASYLADEVERLRQMLQTVEAGGPECRKLVSQWADDHARESQRHPFPF